MARVIAALRYLSVSSVMPIVSIHSATIFIVPTDDHDANTVKALANSIRAALDESNHWRKFQSSDFWYLALKLTRFNVTIHVATQLAASQPTPFEVE